MAPSLAFTLSALLPQLREANLGNPHRRSSPQRRHSAPKFRLPASGCCRLQCCTDGPRGEGAIPQYEPAEQGVHLPPLDPDALQEERDWLSAAVTSWLDAEWTTAEPAPVHARIGERVAAIYSRQRMEGEDDLSGILLAIGQELESFDMSDAFVGPFNVANKVADLIIKERLGPREQMPEYEQNPDAPTWSEDKDEEVRRGQRERNLESENSLEKEVSTRDSSAAPVPPSLADKFDRFMFLKEVLNGSASTDVVSGAIALIVGFVYDPATSAWSGACVKDEYFHVFGDSPPEDVLADEKTIAHLAFRLAEGDEDRTRAEGLDAVIEAYHGAELTKIMRAENTEDFEAREITAKFLHMFGGF